MAVSKNKINKNTNKQQRTKRPRKSKKLEETNDYYRRNVEEHLALEKTKAINLVVGKVFRYREIVLDYRYNIPAVSGVDIEGVVIDEDKEFYYVNMLRVGTASIGKLSKAEQNVKWFAVPLPDHREKDLQSRIHLLQPDFAWYNLKDKQPEHGEKVLVSLGGHTVDIAEYLAPRVGQTCGDWKSLTYKILQHPFNPFLTTTDQISNAYETDLWFPLSTLMNTAFITGFLKINSKLNKKAIKEFKLEKH